MAQSTIVGHENQVLKGSSRPSEAPRSKRSSKKLRKGLALERRYTRPEADPFEGMVWESRSSVSARCAPRLLPAIAWISSMMTARVE